MADLAITPSDVVKGSGARIQDGFAGAAIAAGDAVFKDTADGDKIKLADANATGDAPTTAGVALHGATNGQPIKYQDKGKLTVGSVLTVGKIYVQSATPGKICPSADLATGHKVSILGVAESATSLVLQLNQSGVQVP